MWDFHAQKHNATSYLLDLTLTVFGVADSFLGAAAFLAATAFLGAAAFLVAGAFLAATF